jgi:phosphoribosylglycinamide formyltransferase-1
LTEQQTHGDSASRIPTQRIAVFISGGGRTLRNLVSEIRAGRLPAEIVQVVASKPCPGLDFAKSEGIEASVATDLDREQDVEDLLESSDPDWVIFAGYVKLLPIPERYRGRVVNIHPSLLPKFGGKGMYGHRVHAAVLEAGESESGCTVHLADGEYDRGRIIAQARCPVLAGDTPDTLAARVFELETELYPRALCKLWAEVCSTPAE